MQAATSTSSFLRRGKDRGEPEGRRRAGSVGPGEQWTRYGAARGLGDRWVGEDKGDMSWFGF